MRMMLHILAEATAGKGRNVPRVLFIEALILKSDKLSSSALGKSKTYFDKTKSKLLSIIYLIRTKNSNEKIGTFTGPVIN